MTSQRRFIRLLALIFWPLRHIEELRGWATLTIGLLTLGGLVAAALALLTSSPYALALYALVLVILLTFWAAYQLLKQNDELTAEPEQALVLLNQGGREEFKIPLKGLGPTKHVPTMGIDSLRLRAERSSPIRIDKLIGQPMLRLHSDTGWRTASTIKPEPEQHTRTPSDHRWGFTNDGFHLDGLPITLQRDALIRLPVMMFYIEDADAARSELEDCTKATFNLELRVDTNVGVFTPNLELTVGMSDSGMGD